MESTKSYRMVQLDCLVQATVRLNTLHLKAMVSGESNMKCVYASSVWCRHSAQSCRARRGNVNRIKQRSAIVAIKPTDVEFE